MRASDRRWLGAGQPADGGLHTPGAVQKLLGTFLAQCPQGVVILEGAHALHPRVLPVWINALSEQVCPRRMVSGLVGQCHHKSACNLTSMPSGSHHVCITCWKPCTSSMLDSTCACRHLSSTALQGSFEVDGKPVPAWGALYMATAVLDAATLSQAWLD